MLEPQRFGWKLHISTLARRLAHRAVGAQKTNVRSLCCEPLEDRRLLALTVNTLVDELDGSIVDGDISLRDALAVAPVGETIDFDASLDGGTILLTMGELVIERSMTIDATALPAGLIINAPGLPTFSERYRKMTLPKITTLGSWGWNIHLFEARLNHGTSFSGGPAQGWVFGRLESILNS